MKRVWTDLRRQLVRVKDHVEERIHPRRRARAVDRLERLDAQSVLFVCLGNVCRSPYAEYTLKSLVREGLSVASAGFIGPGRPPPDTALAVARDRGVDHGRHRSRVVTEADLRQADVVFIFDRFNLHRLRRTAGVRRDRVFWLGDLDPVWGGKRAIPDPWGKEPAEFEEVFQRIERCVGIVCDTLDGEASPE